MTARKDHTILTATKEQGIDRDIVEYMQETFGAKAVSITTKGETIQSLSVPRDNFRRGLKKDSNLRAVVRASETRIQDVHVKPLTLGEVMDAKVYVKVAKAVGASKRDGSGMSLSDPIARLHDILSDWGQVKIPALVLLLIAGGTLYGAYRLAKVATDMGEDYATQLKDASTSDKGLDRAIRARSGGQMNPSAQPVEAPKIADKPQPEREQSNPQKVD